VVGGAVGAGASTAEHEGIDQKIENKLSKSALLPLDLSILRLHNRRSLAGNQDAVSAFFFGMTAHQLSKEDSQ
jgi:hypothetical protein